MAILLIFDARASLAAEDAFAKLSKVYRICLIWYQLNRVPFKIVRLDADILKKRLDLVRDLEIND